MKYDCRWQWPNYWIWIFFCSWRGHKLCTIHETHCLRCGAKRKERANNRLLAGCEPVDASYAKCENDLQRIGWLTAELGRLQRSAKDWEETAKHYAINCSGEAARLHAENAELRKAAEWQPEETAPKNGSEIEIIHKNSWVELVRWSFINECWINRNATGQGDGFVGWRSIPPLLKAPSLLELRGAAPNCTDGLPPDEFVRRLREQGSLKGGGG